jgi:NADH-quinone oxidoreductase subunit J
VAGGLGLLLSRNPVSGALWMVLCLFAIACLYLTLNAAFLGVAQILVYAGAVMVLFLFVIMLLNLGALPSLGGLTVRRLVAIVLGAVVLAQLLAIVAVRTSGGPSLPAPDVAVEATSTEALGVALLTDHAFALEMIGVLLLAATIGAVLLAKRRFV